MRASTGVVLALSVAAAAGEAASSSVFNAPLEFAVQALEALPRARSDMEVLDVSGVLDAEERVLVTGGCVDEEQGASCADVSDDAFFFFPARAENRFEAVPPMPRPRLRHSTAVRGDKVYVFGGATSSSLVQVVDVLSLVDLTWSTLGDMLPKAITDGVAYAQGADVFYTGGWLPLENYASSPYSFRLDSADNLLEDGPQFNTPRGDARLVIFEGKPTVLGGFGSDFGALGSMEVLEPTLEWKEHKAQMQQGRGDYGAAVLNGRVFVFGGETSEQSAESHVSASIEVFDPARGKWFYVGQIDAPRFRLAAVSSGTSIQLLGGQEIKEWRTATYDSEFFVLDTVEAFSEQPLPGGKTCRALTDPEACASARCSYFRGTGCRPQHYCGFAHATSDASADQCDANPVWCRWRSELGRCKKFHRPMLT